MPILHADKLDFVAYSMMNLLVDNNDYEQQVVGCSSVYKTAQIIKLIMPTRKQPIIRWDNHVVHQLLGTTLPTPKG